MAKPKLNVRVPRNTKIYRTLSTWDRLGLLAGSVFCIFFGLMSLSQDSVLLGVSMLSAAAYGLWMMTRKTQRLN